MLYYLVKLLAKHPSFQTMSKLFLKSNTIPTNNIEKSVLQIYHQSNKKNH